MYTCILKLYVKSTMYFETHFKVLITNKYAPHLRQMKFRNSKYEYKVIITLE